MGEGGLPNVYATKDRSEIKYTKLNADILSNISDKNCINISTLLLVKRFGHINLIKTYFEINEIRQILLI